MAAFLPVIEDDPMAVEVGEWVIDTALTQIEFWRAAGLDMPVSVPPLTCRIKIFRTVCQWCLRSCRPYPGRRVDAATRNRPDITLGKPIPHPIMPHLRRMHRVRPGLPGAAPWMVREPRPSGAPDRPHGCALRARQSS